MFKIAKLEKVNNEKVSINLITYEQSKYEKGEKILKHYHLISPETTIHWGLI